MYRYIDNLYSPFHLFYIKIIKFKVQIYINLLLSHSASPSGHHLFCDIYNVVTITISTIFCSLANKNDGNIHFALKLT